jgi:hypothetical protein
MGNGGENAEQVVTTEGLESVTPALRELATPLLLYKSLFMEKWFNLLREQDPDARTRDVFTRIQEETNEEAREFIALLREWDAFPDHGNAEKAAGDLHLRLLEDMLKLKERSTEGFLAAGLQAPTEELRNEIIRLADMDRAHADDLRDVLVERAAARHAAPKDAASGPVNGVHVGPFPRGQVGERIRETLDRMRANGDAPTRIILSDTTLRHLRDEGTLDAQQGTLHEIPVDVDFAWAGECVVVQTHERLSLAEIVTHMHTRRGDEARE